jgi:DNA-binding response OmpR family regulator
MAKILIMDDEAAVRNAVDVILSLEGHTVIHAEDGVKALESIKKNLPDVVVCDIEMPNLKGFDVLEELRKNHAISNIPIIFLTGKTDISYLVQAMQLNVNDFLTKPFTEQELVAAINVQLKKINISIQ